MASATNTPVGFIGLGNMGWPMARNLRTAGFDLVVYDAAVETASRFADEFGATIATSPAAFADCEVVITMLPNDTIVRQVVLDWDGGVASQMKRGSIVLDMSSSSPTGIQGIAAGAAEYEVTVVDSPVSGGVPRAETGELSLMVGGDDETVAAVTPILEVLGARTFRTGPLGSGDAVKALNNFLAAANYVSATEALRIGERFGVDPATLFEVINASTGRSFVTEVVIGGHVVPGTYATGFQLALLAKDVGIAAGLASDLDMSAESPALALTNQRWQEAVGGAAPGTDHSAAHRQWWPESAAVSG